MVLGKPIRNKDSFKIPIELFTELRKSIKIVLNIPEELYPADGITRVFDIIRIHKENAEILSDLDQDEKTVTIESDEFSAYILCYKDTNEAEVKDTPAAVPADKPKGAAKNPTTATSSRTSSPDDKETPDDEGNKLPYTGKKAEKEETKNMVYYFLILIAAVIAGCIGIVIKKSHRKKRR